MREYPTRRRKGGSAMRRLGLCILLVFTAALCLPLLAQEVNVVEEESKAQNATPQEEATTPANEIQEEGVDAETTTVPEAEDATELPSEQIPPAEIPLTKEQPLEEEISPEPEQEEKEEKPYYLPAYLKLLEDYPELALIEHWGKPLSKPFIFLGLLLFIACGGNRLVHRTYNAKYPEHRGSVPWWIYGIKISVWLFALTVACEVIGLHYISVVGGSIISFIGAILHAAVWLLVGVLVAGIVAHSFSRSGRELVLSLLGYLYLQYDPRKPGKSHEFDLGDGEKGRIESVDLLHTTFIVNGKKVKRPNSWVMQQYYGWGRELSQEESPDDSGDKEERHE
ncbi:hypothetical protein ES702_00887 [subsurface metagenome]